MTIHTIKPKEDTYVRIFPCSSIPNEFVLNNLNRVVKLTAITEFQPGDDEGPDLVFFDLDGEAKCIDKKDTELITDKEYFEGKLRYG